MFVVSCLLAAHLTILKIFCQFTSLWIRYMYSQITFTTMFKFSNWNHISNEGPLLAIAWHIGNLVGKLIICPNLDNLFWSTKHRTGLHWPHVTTDWQYPLRILGLTLRSIPRTSPAWNAMGLRTLSEYIFLPMLGFLIDFVSHHYMQFLPYLEGRWQIQNS